DGVAYDPTRDRIYVTNHTSESLAVFDADTLTPLGGSPFATMGQSISVAVDSVNDRVYTANFVDNTITVFDAATMALVTTLPTAGNAYSVTYDPVADRILVANESTDNLTVFDGATLTEIAGSPFAVGQTPHAVVVEGEDVGARLQRR